MCHRPKQNLRLLQLSAQHNSEDDEPFRVVDPNVVEVRNIQGIIARKTVRVDDAVRQDHALHDRHQRGGPGIRDHHRVDLPSTLQQPENRDFPSRAPTTFALPDASEVTLIDLDLSGDRRGLLHLLGDHLTKPTLHLFVPRHPTSVEFWANRPEGWQTLGYLQPSIANGNRRAHEKRDGRRAK